MKLRPDDSDVVTRSFLGVADEDAARVTLVRDLRVADVVNLIQTFVGFLVTIKFK